MNIDWSTVINESLGTESSYLDFYDKVEDILNHMAPYRKMTQRNVRLEQRPWITRGLLVSMKVRDKLSKSRARAKDPQIKSELSGKYKRYRNMIVTLLKQSKNSYYSSYFLPNQTNIKKTCDGKRNLINVSKTEISHQPN